MGIPGKIRLPGIGMPEQAVRASSFALAALFAMAGQATSAPAYGGDIPSDSVASLSGQINAANDDKAVAAAISSLAAIKSRKSLSALCSLMGDATLTIHERKLLYQALEEDPQDIPPEGIHALVTLVEPWYFFTQRALKDFYPKCRFSAADLRAVCAKFANLSNGYKPYSLIFCTSHHRIFANDPAYLASISKEVQDFLTATALDAAELPSILRPWLAQAMIEWHLPGAPEVLIDAIADGMTQHDLHKGTASAYPAINLLSAFASRSTGFHSDQRMPPDDEIFSVSQEWMKWWAENNRTPGYTLPVTPEQQKKRGRIPF
jgi:hypothetical protein